MKQFIICLFLNVVVVSAFNITEYNEPASIMVGFIVLCIWLVPIALNYLNGEENFK